MENKKIYGYDVIAKKEILLAEVPKKAKYKDYGFIVRFKRKTSKKERQRIIKLMLKQKCVNKIQGAITFT